MQICWYRYDILQIDGVNSEMLGIGQTESSEWSLSSHSERFSDDRVFSAYISLYAANMSTSIILEQFVYFVQAFSFDFCILILGID